MLGYNDLQGIPFPRWLFRHRVEASESRSSPIMPGDLVRSRRDATAVVAQPAGEFSQ
jgi:hypothetical protein